MHDRIALAVKFVNFDLSILEGVMPLQTLGSGCLGSPAGAQMVGKTPYREWREGRGYVQQQVLAGWFQTHFCMYSKNKNIHKWVEDFLKLLQHFLRFVLFEMISRIITHGDRSRQHKSLVNDFKLKYGAIAAPTPNITGPFPAYLSKPTIW